MPTTASLFTVHPQYFSAHDATMSSRSMQTSRHHPCWLPFLSNSVRFQAGWKFLHRPIGPEASVVCQKKYWQIMLPTLGVKLWNFAFDLQGPQHFTIAWCFKFDNGYWIALPTKLQPCNSNTLSTRNETRPHLALRVALQTQNSKPNMKNQLHQPSFRWEPETVYVAEINMCRPYY